jgi:hypothetical protein
LLRIDEAFPKELRKKTVDDEMRIEFLNGASWQVMGSDNFDTSVGAAPAGLVFSEWALAKPEAWALLQPILVENGGWALFITTPRGRNHAQRTLKLAQEKMGDGQWFGQVLSAEETGVFAAGELEEIRRELVNLYGPELGEAMFRQEYMCSFEGAVLGAFYAAALEQIERRDQISVAPYDRSRPVITGWDIGVNDSTAVWFVQRIGRGYAVIDYLETMNRGAADLAAELTDRGYRYSEHLLPHDAGAREKGTAKSYETQLKDAGLKGETRVLDRARDTREVIGGINQGRALISRCTFDEKACERGLDCLRNYRSEWDEKSKVLSTRPKHDWTSHGADAWRTLAVGLREGNPGNVDRWGNRIDGDLSPDFGTLS